MPIAIRPEMAEYFLTQASTAEFKDLYLFVLSSAIVVTALAQLIFRHKPKNDRFRRQISRSRIFDIDYMDLKRARLYGQLDFAMPGLQAGEKL